MTEPYPFLERLQGLDVRGIKLGLEAIDAVCARLGRPERTVPCVLVGGTNGKGSTAATLASIASAAGLTVGLYTSPHLIEVTERLRVGSWDVDAEELDQALAEVFAAADRAPRLPLTYFESLTAAAFVLFAEQRLDLAIYEVGLGGRLDATNLAPADVSVVTSIDLDHMADLGPTRKSIAREKAGIFRSERPALGLAADSGARLVLAEAAEAAGAVWHDASRELRLSGIETGLDGTRFRLETPVGAYALETPLPGVHQAWNTALAVRAAELLPGRVAAVTAEACVAGRAFGPLARTPGTLPWSLAALFFSTAATTRKARTLCRASSEETGLSGEIDLVFAAMADKDVEGMAARLFPCARPRAHRADRFVARSGSGRARPTRRRACPCRPLRARASRRLFATFSPARTPNL